VKRLIEDENRLYESVDRMEMVKGRMREEIR